MDKNYKLLFVLAFILISANSVMLLFDIGRDKISLNIDEFKDFCAVVISSVSLIITICFAIMAISAYGKIQDIEKVSEQANCLNNEIDNLKKKKDEVSKLLSESKDNLIKVNDASIHIQKSSVDVANLFLSFCEELIAIADTQNNLALKRKYSTIRARMSYTNMMLPEEMRINLLRELSVYGNHCDIEALRELSSSSSEHVRNLARYVLEDLHNKLENPPQ